MKYAYLELGEEVLSAVAQLRVGSRQVADPALAILGIAHHGHLGHLVDHMQAFSLIQPLARRLDFLRLVPRQLKGRLHAKRR